MCIIEYVLALTLALFLSILFTRGVFNLSIDYLINRSRKKKIKQGQTLKEWFFFVRFREILPKWMFHWYYLTFFVYVATVGAEVILHLSGAGEIVLQWVLRIAGGILILPGAIVLCLCRSRKQPSGFDMARILGKGKDNR